MWQAAMAHARSLGHDVRVLASDYRDSEDRGEEDPDVYRSLRWYWDLNRYQFPRLNLAQRIALERHNAVELARHLKEFRPEVVSWWSMGCMSLSLIERVRRAGLRAAFIVHDDWLVYGPQYDQWLRMWRGKRLILAPLVERLLRVPTQVEFGRAGTYVFNSRYTLGRALQTGLEPIAASVVHPGIDERFLSQAPAHAWTWRLVYVGRIDRQKGIDTAVRALPHLPPSASLSVWGSGDALYVDEMKRLAQELGVGGRVHFAGQAGADALTQVYADADVLVFPVRWEEPFGLVPLEAMGIGTPVVTTSRGGTSEFVQDGDNALVFEPDDHVALAGLIVRLAEDGQLRDRLRAGGERTAARHTLARFAEQTVEKITA